jgi:hypothetical protein
MSVSLESPPDFRYYLTVGTLIPDNPLGKTMKDLGKAFSFIFEDPSWVLKVVIAGLFMLLSFVGLGIFVLLGYIVELTQRVMRREQYPLPEWKDVGVKFLVGFKYFIVLFMYALPIILLMIPLIVLLAITAVSGPSEGLSTIVAVYTFGFVLLMIPYALLLTILTPIITYRFAVRERIADGLDIGGIIADFKRNWQNTVVVALISVGLESFAGIGIFAFLIGIFFTMFYAYAVSGYMYGELYLSTQEGVTV